MSKITQESDDHEMSSSTGSSSRNRVTSKVAAKVLGDYSILTDDFIIEHSLRYVGMNQYRFIASVSRQYHRIYTSLFTDEKLGAVTHVTLDMSTGSNATAKNSAIAGAFAFINAHTPKQTYHNVSTLEHLTMCYNETINKNGRWNEKSYFYKCVGRNATIAQLQYLYSKFDCEYGVSEICESAAGSGRLEVIQYFIEYHQLDDYKVHGACYKAAEFGHLHIVQYFHTHKYPVSYKSATHALKNGHLNILEYLGNGGITPSNFEFRYNDWDDIVRNDSLDIIKYLQGRGFKVDFDLVCSLGW
jgi:hypothetical protein